MYNRVGEPKFNTIKDSKGESCINGSVQGRRDMICA